MKNKKLKKTIALLTVLVMILGSFTGCGKKEDPKSQQTGLANPMTEISADEIPFPFEIPADAKDAKFFQIKGADDAEPMYQMSFTLSGKEFTYRMQSTSEMEAYDMSGLNYDKWDTAEASVSYVPATIKTNKSAGAIYWLDKVPGVNYTVGCTSEVDANSLKDVAAAVFASAQSEAEGDPTFTMDYTGFYHDDNYDTVEIFAGPDDEPVEDGYYRIEIGIFRLSTFSGYGHEVEGLFEFTVTDPAGGDMEGKFYPAGNGTYSLAITDSTWSLLPTDTLFEGFNTEIPDLSGAYASDGAKVAVSMREDGDYDLIIDVIRLTQFEAKGFYYKGAIEFKVTDANGGNILGVFFRSAEDDDTWILDFYDSDWSLLESGTTFEGLAAVE